MMGDNLDKPQLKMLYEWADKSDLTIAIGTSLSGMNADQIAEKTALRKI